MMLFRQSVFPFSVVTHIVSHFHSPCGKEKIII
jgi:hypothetical protein